MKTENKIAHQAAMLSIDLKEAAEALTKWHSVIVELAEKAEVLQRVIQNELLEPMQEGEG